MKGNGESTWRKSTSSGRPPRPRCAVSPSTHRPCARKSSARPDCSSNSMVLACTASALDRGEGAGCLSMILSGTPRRIRSTARLRPTGPAPTIRTCTDVVTSDNGHSCGHTGGPGPAVCWTSVDHPPCGPASWSATAMPISTPAGGAPWVGAGPCRIPPSQLRDPEAFEALLAPPSPRRPALLAIVFSGASPRRVSIRYSAASPRTRGCNGTDREERVLLLQAAQGDPRPDEGSAAAPRGPGDPGGGCGRAGRRGTPQHSRELKGGAWLP